MSFIATIHQEPHGRDLRFLVIGGLAVNHYGCSRDTSDLDIFIGQNDRAAWMELLARLGYTDYEDGGNFIQYAAPAESAWPVDLMLVQGKNLSANSGGQPGGRFFRRQKPGTIARTSARPHTARLEKHSDASVLERFLGCGKLDPHQPTRRYCRQYPRTVHQVRYGRTV